jgi:hypothetical protein
MNRRIIQWYGRGALAPLERVVAHANNGRYYRCICCSTIDYLLTSIPHPRTSLRLNLVGRMDRLGESLLQSLRGELLNSLGDLGWASSMGFLGITSGIGVVDLFISYGTKA